MLADRLIGDGVEVLLDVYDLREGDDRFAYMERSVTDSSVTKVVAITDHAYKGKMDDRKGGVGIEGTIMSAKIYQQISGEDNKFVAVVFEADSDGRAHLPAMFDSKFYIDMSSNELLEGNYEQLVRFLYNKPLRKKPAIGRRPSFLLEDDRPQLLTVGKVAALRDAVTRDRLSSARGLFADYIDTLEDVLTATPAAVKDGRHPDLELGVREVERFMSYRKEFVQTLQFLTRHGDLSTLGIVDLLKKFFERAMGFAERLGRKANLKAEAFGHIHFAVYELFVYTSGLLWKEGKVEELMLILEHPYFVDINDGRGPRYTNYGSLSVYLELFEGRPEVFVGYNGSKQAKLMHDHADSGALTWSEVCEADAILWLRAFFLGGQQGWYPRTVAFWEETPFPSFARAESQRNAASLARILGVQEATLKTRLAEVCSSRRGLLGDQSRFVGLETCFNLGRICTRA